MSAVVAATGQHHFCPHSLYGATSCRVQACIAMYAPLNPVQVIDQHKLAQLFGVIREERSLLYQQATPSTYLTPMHPPILLLHGSNDTTVPLDQTLSYAERLQTAAIDHTTVILPDAGHLPEQEVLLPHIRAFLTTHLRRQGGKDSVQ